MPGIFLDSAGSSLPSTATLERMITHLRREAEVGGYRAEIEQEAELAEVYESLGALLGCRADELALSDSATRAWTSYVAALALRPGDRVLITGAEYASSAMTLFRRARQDGISVEVVPLRADGVVDLAELADRLDERVRLVSASHVATYGGLVQPVRAIADLAHAVGALVVVDACQSVGQLPVDVDTLGADALTGTSRKWLRGPRGVGFLYVRDAGEPLEPVALDRIGATWTGPASYAVRADARCFELGESSVAARLGFGVAVRELLELGQRTVEARIQHLRGALRAGLGKMAGVRLRDPAAGPLSGIVTFSVGERSAAAVRAQLAERGVTVSVSVPDAALLDALARDLPPVVRASPHHFLDDAAIESALAAIDDCVTTV